jgi:hypothetical protein
LTLYDNDIIICLMSEYNTGLSQEDNDIARDLYSNKHKRFAESLMWALDLNRRADEMRSIVEKARSDGFVDAVPYEDRVFANGERTQRGMLEHAQLHYDANLWRAHEHNEKHLSEYIEQAKIDMAETDR